MIKIGRNDRCPCGSGKKYKKCCLNKPERKVYETLSKFFGVDWIEKSLEKTKLTGYHNLNPQNLAAMDIHPVIKAIIGTQTKLQNSEQQGKTPITLGSSEALQEILHHNLTVLEPELEFRLVQRRLRDKLEFPKIEYELTIAAGYKRLGYQVSFIPTQTGKRTGEFYVIGSGQKFLVECKKKDLVTSQEKSVGNWWDEFQHLMMKEFLKSKDGFGLIITIPTAPKKEDIKLIVAETVSQMGKIAGSDKFVVKGLYPIQLTKFCGSGESISASEFYAFGEDCDLRVTRNLQHKSEWPAGNKKTSQVYEPAFVGAIVEKNLEGKLNGVISTLADAYGQLEEDKPNVVYVDVNVSSMMPEYSAKLFAQLVPAIEQKLERDYSRISAVVLTNIKFLDAYPYTGLHCEEVCIKNKKSKHLIPNNVKILGDKTEGQSILEDWKTVLNL